MSEFVADHPPSDEPEHEIVNPVTECSKLQKRYYRCVQKFAGCFVAGQIREESRDVCLNRFDDFRECVEGAARKMNEQQSQKKKDKSWWR